MLLNRTLNIFRILTIALLLFSLVFAQNSFPAKHADLEKPISYESMGEFLDNIAELDFIETSIVGKSAGGNDLFLVHLSHGKPENPWKVFLIGQQHGNEPAGKDALLYLIRYIAEQPQRLPDDVDLWIMPMVNPDGAIANKRRNGNDFDLNRDHKLLSQPETQTLHRIYREIRPHVSVDCHEFGRDSRDYARRGWDEWPLIMMDCANHPIIEKDLYLAGQRWCEQIEKPLLAKGHNYCRYYLGGVPPEGELRHSTPETDDARNGLGIYQGLSFIIESGIKHNAENPNADLHQRVDAYLQIFDQFLRNDEHRQEDMEIIRRAGQSALPPFIPTNYFWGNVGRKISLVKVIEKATGNVIEIPTADFMNDLIVKKSVAAPLAYLIPAAPSELFKTLLDRHAIPYRELQESTTLLAEACLLERIEKEFDPIYSRYDGRHIVSVQNPEELAFDAKSLLVELTGNDAKRAAVLLEPTMFYGLYEDAEFHNMITEDGVMPVFRVISY